MATTGPSTSADQDGVVSEGMMVVLDVNNGEKLIITQVTKNGKIKLNKQFLPTRTLAGQSFGTIFETGKDGKSFVVGTKDSLAVLNGSFTNTEIVKNNATLNDDGTAQKLSKEDIDKLKGEGVTGGDLIAKIVENSATFQSKTEFSQEKYKRKKQKKYCTAFMLCRPCAQNICEAYFKKSPEKICGLRVDSLALLMNMANIGAYSRVLILEESFGMVLASVLERLGGYGQVCSASAGDKTFVDIVRYFNFEEDVASIGRLAKVNDLRKMREESIASGAVGEVVEVVEMPQQQKEGVEEEDNSNEERAEKRLKIEKTENGSDATLDQKKMVTTCTRDDKQKQKCYKAVRKVYFPKWASKGEMQEMAAHGFSNLIVVAPKYSPESIMDRIACLLAPSATFAVFSQWLQPLVECRIAMQKAKLAVGMQLTETFWREHQVLPGRSHPHMNMTTGPSSGYILSGIMTAEVLQYSSKCTQQSSDGNLDETTQKDDPSAKQAEEDPVVVTEVGEAAPDAVDTVTKTD